LPAPWEATGDATVTFSQDIAPLLARRCVVCHRPGEAAPFSLTCYDDALAWAATIAEVVEQGRMPPWYADPRYGSFANDTHLSADEKRLIATWVDEGCPPGEKRGALIDVHRRQPTAGPSALPTASFPCQNRLQCPRKA